MTWWMIGVLVVSWLVSGVVVAKELTDAKEARPLRPDRTTHPYRKRGWYWGERWPLYVLAAIFGWLFVIWLLLMVLAGMDDTPLG